MPQYGHGSSIVPSSVTYGLRGTGTNGAFAVSDLSELSIRCQVLAGRIISELDDEGYGPRLWLRFERKKRALAAAREILHEARLLAGTSMLSSGPPPPPPPPVRKEPGTEWRGV